MKCIIATVALIAGTIANAAPVSDLSGGQTGRIEFQSMNVPSM